MSRLRPWFPPALRFNTADDAIAHFESVQAGITPDWSRVVQPHLRLENSNRIVPNPAYEEAQYELGYMVCKDGAWIDIAKRLGAQGAATLA